MGTIESTFLGLVHGTAVASDNKGVFSYNTIWLVNILYSLKAQADNVDVANVSWESSGEHSKVFDMYVDGYMQLQEIVRLYQQLLYNDIEAINTISKNMLKLDSELAKKLK